MREIERQGIEGRIPDLLRGRVAGLGALEHLAGARDGAAGQGVVPSRDGRGRGDRLQAPSASARALRPVGDPRVPHLAGHAAAGVEPAVILTAGQQLASDAAGALSAVLPVPAGGIAPWREHRVRFDNQRLDHALAELARYGDPQLLVRDPAVAALPITGVFDPRDMATFRRLLSASLPVRLQAARGGAAEVVLAR